MSEHRPGRVVMGNPGEIQQAYLQWETIPVDQEMPGGEVQPMTQETTLARPISVTGPGTFMGKDERTLILEPLEEEGGWRFDRTDLKDQLPIYVSVRNVWTTARNVVLCSGSPRNYMRMAEHMIALRVGLGLDHLMIRLDSGDPPLFDRGSMDLLEAVEDAELQPLARPATYLTVKEPVTLAAPGGRFLTFLPAENGDRTLYIDCTIDFKSAIGRQRIRFPVTPETFRYGSVARTNCTFLQMLYCRTIGKIFADVRNLGYTTRNILIHGRRRYFNRPRLMHNGKALEAVWHRATLDLLAAVALIDRGRLAGTILSYKAGHALDVDAVRTLYKKNLLEPF